MASCVLSRNRKTSAVSSLVLNLFASQIGEFFLPQPVGEVVTKRNVFIFQSADWG